MDRRAPVSRVLRARERCVGGVVEVGRRALRVRRWRFAVVRRVVMRSEEGGGWVVRVWRVDSRSDVGDIFGGGGVGGCGGGVGEGGMRRMRGGWSCGFLLWRKVELLLSVVQMEVKIWWRREFAALRVVFTNVIGLMEDDMVRRNQRTELEMRIGSQRSFRISALPTYVAIWMAHVESKWRSIC